MLFNQSFVSRQSSRLFIIWPYILTFSHYFLNYFQKYASVAKIFQWYISGHHHIKKNETFWDHDVKKNETFWDHDFRNRPILPDSGSLISLFEDNHKL